ncbi:MAG TPA: Sec-independent protein translocase subunit TatA [Candidatus Nanopelagicales bacterium]|jgi:sec-independent protein translocase protein TatA|nr:Sec-independent protein translocase subunit TatA [Candidatus Nanopelagicales bacterium]
MGGVFERPGFWIVLLVLVLLLFGAKRLPDLSRSVGRSLRIFKAETDGMRSDEKGEQSTTAEQAGPPVITPPPAPPAEPRYLVDPDTGERVLAQPVQRPPQQPS